VAVAYQLHNALVAPGTEAFSKGSNLRTVERAKCFKSIAFRELEPVWRCMGLAMPATANASDADADSGMADRARGGVVVTELNPAVLESEVNEADTATFAAVAAQYESLCTSSMRQVLSTGAGDVVALGRETREHWERLLPRLGDVVDVHGATWTRSGSGVAERVELVRAVPGGAKVTVWFAPHPSAWQQSQRTLRVLARTHGLPCPLAHRSSFPSSPSSAPLSAPHSHPSSKPHPSPSPLELLRAREVIPLLDVTRSPEAVEVVSLEVCCPHEEGVASPCGMARSPTTAAT